MLKKLDSQMIWRNFRNGLMQVHLWLALILCLPMIVIGISGSALLLQREILAASIPSAGASGEQRPIPAIVAAAQAASAGGRGRVLAFLKGIHGFLASPPPIGLPFVGWTGVIMTLMGLSGLVLWWPRQGQWRQGFLVRRGTRGLPFYFDLHRVAGIWGLLVFLAVSVSGIYLTFPQTIGPFVRAHLSGEDTVTNPQPGFAPRTGAIGPDDAIALARSAVPNARVPGLELPDIEKSFVVELAPQGLAPNEPHVVVVVDANSADLSYIDDPRNYSFRDQLLNWQYLLHFGVGLGWFWTVLVFLFCLLPLLLAVSGLTVWWKKRKARKLAPNEAAAPAE